MAIEMRRAIPELGQLVVLRDRHWVVADIARSSLPEELGANRGEPQHLLTLSSVEDDGLGEELRVIWEIEVGARILETATLPTPVGRQFDPPDRLDAFIDAIRWGAVTSADPRTLQAPFRSGITIEDYQLEPVVQAMRMPRANLLIADDVGLGKTIEAGLVVQELLLRHRARTVLIVCPASLCLKWRAEMLEKFGLEFRLVNSETLSELRRTRGVQANPWRHYPRLIVSIDWLKGPRAMRLLNDVLPPTTTTYPRAFDVLIVDEVHTCAPSGRGKYAVDSLRTKAIEKLAGHFEHRLFLSATPHNGYLESFTGLLALLDSQRFARGVRPPQDVLAQVMVRRLKSELRETLPDGRMRFPERQIVALPVTYSDDERRAHADLVAYASARLRSAAGDAVAAQATDLVTVLLKQRLFSSPLAFQKTLAVHQESLARRAAGGVGRRALQLAADSLDDDHADESELDEATETALLTSSRAMPAMTPEQTQILDRLARWANTAAGRPDSKARELIRWVRGIVREGDRWTDERVIIFTQFRDTQRWYAELLTAEGLGGDRLALLYGGMDEQLRERVKAQFQAHPSAFPVRILLATDAASEGIDLQRHCHQMVHLEIPFNPMRLEQRNGRIDRHGQRSPVVLIHHFVGAGWKSAPSQSLEADLEFLSRTARKVEAIRDDLGSVAPVLAQQVEEAMLGRRRDLDEPSVDRRAQQRRLAALERNLRDEVARLRSQLDDSIAELHINAEATERVVRVGLDLGNQLPLRTATLVRPPDEPGPSAPVYELPPLSGGWAHCALDLPHPANPALIRPITFDAAVAANHDDVVHVHLGHPLVQMAMRLLRAEIWSSGADVRMSRVTARVVPDEALGEPAVVANARLVVAGADGRRLHEEVMEAGGYVRRGGFARFERIGDLRRALEAATENEPSAAVVEALRAEWPSIERGLLASVERRAEDRMARLRGQLADRAAEDERKIRGVLTDLLERINRTLTEPQMSEAEQLTLFVEEREQLHRDVDALRRRAAEIPDEIEREVALVRGRYDAVRHLVFPAAVTFLVPARMAATR